MSESKSTSGVIGFIRLLSIVFITLKLTNFIDWSWWWVLSPIWIVFVLIIIVILVLSYLETYHKS